MRSIVVKRFLPNSVHNKFLIMLLKLLVLLTVTTTAYVNSENNNSDNNGVTFKNITLVMSNRNYEKKNMKLTTSSRNLKDILPDDTLALVGIMGKIPVLREHSVANIKNVKKLVFYKNEMLDIQPGAIQNLTGIRSLNIQHNNLTNLKRGTFKNLTVEDLDISHNHIHNIDNGAFENLPNLEVLRLSKNEIETLGEHVFSDLPVKYLDLSSNQISTLADDIFSNVSQLRILILRSNKFEEIPISASLSTIEHLDLSSNFISKLPAGIFRKLPQLQHIDLSGNKLTEIHENVFNGLNLQALKVDRNKISYIAPSAFNNMTKLANIFLNSNILAKYDTNWFYNTKNIYRLHLSYNLIEEIPDRAFENIYNNKKQWINMKSNKIRKISPRAFEGFKNFDVLNLSENKIESWDENMLKDTEIIFYLDLKSNELKCLEGNFDNIFKANFTYLYGNPLTKQCMKNIESWKDSKSNTSHVVCTDLCFR